MCRVSFAKHFGMNCNEKHKNIPFFLSPQFIKNHIFLQKLGLFEQNIKTIFKVLIAESFKRIKTCLLKSICFFLIIRIFFRIRYFCLGGAPYKFSRFKLDEFLF